MKIKIPDYVNLRNLLFCAIITVSSTIIIHLALNVAGPSNRYFKGGRAYANSHRMTQQCKRLVLKEPSVDWGYFYFYENAKTKKSIVWCKVPKAGSTTLTKIFLRQAGAKNFQNSTRIHKLLREFYPRTSAKVMKQRLNKSEKFLVVRHPFERVLSAYRDKLESYERDLKFRDGYYYDHYGRFMVSRTPQNASGNASATAVPTRMEPTWNEFITYLLKTSVSRYDEHWMPITRLCSPCTVGFDLIVKMENLNKDLKKPLRRAGFEIKNLGWSHRTGTQDRRVINSYFRNLTFVQVKKLYLKYKQDFQLFGYTPYKYFRLFANQTQPEIKN